MTAILVVEDEKRIRTIVADYLQKAGYQVVAVDSGEAAAVALQKHRIDLAVLDIRLPGMDGFTLCEHIRESDDMPVIFLTAREDDQDKLKGYRLGADDYITKPFSPGVLVAKIKVLLRRSGIADESAVVSAGGIELYPLSHEIFAGGEKVQLTRNEYELLLLFMQNPRQVFSREQLLNRIWGYDFAGTTRTVDAHIKNLRHKMGEEGRHIRTLIRSGYKFEVQEND